MYITRYMPPTNTRGARIRATDDQGQSITVPYPHELHDKRAHYAAIAALRGHTGAPLVPLVPASIPRGYAWAVVYPSDADAAIAAWDAIAARS